MRDALKTAISHIEHMAAWIEKQNAGYSFESLGEDMPGIRAAVNLPLAYVSDMTGRHISEDLQRNLLDDSAFVGAGDFGPLGKLTSDCYRMLRAAENNGDMLAVAVLTYMHERICRARCEISGDPPRALPRRPYPDEETANAPA